MKNYNYRKIKNFSFKSKIKTFIKNFYKVINENLEFIKILFYYKLINKNLDKFYIKGVYKINKINNIKKKINLQFKNLIYF